MRHFAIASALLAVSAIQAFAAGSVSQSISRQGATDRYVITFDWTGDASTGSVPSSTARLVGPGLPDFQGYDVLGAQFIPGSPAPTDGYDVTITDGSGVDVLGGNGLDRSATTPSSVAADTNALPLNGTITMNLSGNSVASAHGRVLVFVQKPSLNALIRNLQRSGGSGMGDLLAANNLNDVQSASASRANLGLAIGTNVQAYDSELACLAGLASAADKAAYFTGSGTCALADFTSFGRSIAACASSSACRTVLGLVIGTDVQAFDSELSCLAGLVSAANKLAYFTGSGTCSLADLSAFARTMLDDSDAATIRSTIGVVIGTDVQAYDADLACLAGLVSAADKIPYFTGSGTCALADLSSAMRTFLTTPSSANLLALLTTKTGTGNAVFGTQPTIDKPVLTSYTVATLPTPTNGMIVPITDSADGTCTAGTGATLVWCRYNGSAWAAIGGGGGSADDLGCTSGTTAPTTGTAYTCYIRTDTTPMEFWVFVATDTPYLVPAIADPTAATYVTLLEAAANGNNYRKLLASDSLSNDLNVKFFESTTPSDGDCVKASVTGSTITIEGNGAACGSGSGGGGISGSSSIDFPSLADGQCSDQTFSLTGLTGGMALSVGLPASLSSGFLGTGIASAADTAKIRLCNLSGATVDLASLTYSVTHPTAISGSGTIDFSSLGDGACSTNTFTLTGAAAGTRVSKGLPAALEAGLIGDMVVTATDTVTVRLCNFSGAALDPASGTFSASIL